MTAIEYLEKKLLDKMNITPILYSNIFEEAKELENKEISNDEILKESIEHSKIYKNKFAARNAFYEGVKWYREQLKKK